MSDFSVLWTVLGIGLLIFVHELGHYLAARFAKVRVEVFSLGFGPRLLGWKIGPTDYRISAVPLGGYVKVAGDDPTDRRYLQPDDLHAKGFLARAFFFSGGVLMNLLFALVAFPLVFKSGVEFTAPVLGDVVPGGAAWAADLRPGDRVLSVDGKRMYSFENFGVEVALAGGAEIELEIERDGQRLEKVVRPRWAATAGLYGIEVLPAVETGPPKLFVEKGTSGYAAGLRPGDLLVAFDGGPVDTSRLEKVLAQHSQTRPKAITLGILRDGKAMEITVTPEIKQADEARIGVGRTARHVRGLRAPATSAMDLRIGDRILAIDGRPFYGPDFADAETGSEPLRLTVEREGKSDPVQLELAASGPSRRDFLAGVAIGDDLRGLTIRPVPGSPAAAAGMLAGDRITALDGQAVAEWPDLQRTIRTAGTRPVKVTYERAGKIATIEVAPSREYWHPGFTVRAPHRREVYKVDDIGGTITAGVVCSIDLVKQLYVTLKRLFTGEVAATNLGGIIQISVVTHEFAKSGWARFFYFLGLLSINLAFMNFLPIPVLDGGHMLFLLIERVKGSPVSPRTLGYAQIAGLVFLIALMLFVTYNDIRRHF